QPFARYAYDPTRALQELVEAGWRRAADGRILNAAGAPAQFELRGGVAYGNAIPVVAADWRRLGLDVSEFITPAQLNSDPERQAQFPSFELRGRSSSEGIFPGFDSREAATAQNRFQGANYSHYGNSALDRLIDKIYGTLDARERATVLKDAGELMAADLPALPFYYGVNFLHVRKTLRGSLEEDYPHTNDISGGAVARSAHLWERV
ncbi:MAG: peptide transporter, partial [Chloroflexi bacterium]|nr:peptide transporter [Chloroflexota bacterium]